MPSDKYFLEDMFSEFDDKAGRRSMMEGMDRDHLYFFSKKYKHRTIMEFCITLVRCNHICI